MSAIISRTIRSSATVLVAEDHDDSRDALRALLEAAGYRVLLAHNGREAVDMALSTHPDVVVMDIMMPDMDGLEATRLLRASSDFVGVPIIALTALAGGRDRALAAGCDDFVSKPLNVPSFFRTLEAWVVRTAEGRNER